jgi:hypothetical protein
MPWAALGMARADRVDFHRPCRTGILRWRVRLSLEGDRRAHRRNEPAAEATTSGKEPMSAARSLRTSALTLSLAIAACAGEGDGDEARNAGDAGGDQPTAEGAQPANPLLNPASEAMNQTAPDVFQARFETSKGDAERRRPVLQSGQQRLLRRRPVLPCSGWLHGPVRDLRRPRDVGRMAGPRDSG